MASDWIKIRIDLHDDPSVISVSHATSLDVFSIVGRLTKLWGWVSAQTIDGHAHGVTKKWLDRYLDCDGFSDALENAGWLISDTNGISIPNFDHHNSQSDKARALASNRQAKKRGGDLENVTLVSRLCHAPTGTRSPSSLLFSSSGGKSAEKGVFTRDDVNSILAEYPNKRKLMGAVNDVEYALAGISRGDAEYKPLSPKGDWPPEDPVAWLRERVMAFAASAEAQKTAKDAHWWFQDKRFLEDDATWQDKKSAAETPPGIVPPGGWNDAPLTPEERADLAAEYRRREENPNAGDIMMKKISERAKKNAQHSTGKSKGQSVGPPTGTGNDGREVQGPHMPLSIPR